MLYRYVIIVVYIGRACDLAAQLDRSGHSIDSLRDSDDDAHPIESGATHGVTRSVRGRNRGLVHMSSGHNLVLIGSRKARRLIRPVGQTVATNGSSSDLSCVAVTSSAKPITS